DRLETIPWTAADLALIDEAKVLLGPTDGAELRTYGHIVVDEAQDLSPMQLRMLARRSISGSMTVVGDVAQATGAEAPSGWAEPARHLAPRRRPNITELTVNYRTPAEIMDVAARVLAVAEPGLVPPRSVRSTGVRPRAVAVVPGEPLAEVVARTAREELEALGEAGGTVAVVASDTGAEALAPALADALARFGLDLGLPERDGLDRPVTLLPIGLVKGLEFDAVVVVEPDAILGQEAQGMRSLYVALTRATRRLAVVHARPLPDVLEAGGLETGRLEVGESVSSLGS
ncbi:MAG TPA: ATP-binding domain-containing protein, partial [Acidimicrobiales bacterium]|nr:ATP-binding domain-containing protein [Acidimicrobiales bacterium]